MRVKNLIQTHACAYMASNLTFLSQSVSRAGLYSSRLPQQCSKIHHVSNNLVSKAHTNLLFIGKDISYAIYENNHACVSWMDESVKVKIQPQDNPYNLVIVANDQFSVKTLYDIKDHLAQNVILAVVNSRMLKAEKLLERSVALVPGLRLFSKVEIYDRNNERGWDNGIVLYDIVKDGPASTLWD